MPAKPHAVEIISFKIRMSLTHSENAAIPPVISKMLFIPAETCGMNDSILKRLHMMFAVPSDSNASVNAAKNITEAIQALFGIEAHKIRVVKMK